MTALVLGASGFVGGWLIRKLVDDGVTVHAAGRDASAVANRCEAVGATRVDLHEVDALDDLALSRLMEKVRPQHVFNGIGYGVDRSERDESLADEINHRLVVRLGELAVRFDVARLLHLGSALEYGAIAGNLSEDSTPNATTQYGRTKLAGTRALSRLSEARDLSAVTLRLFMLYGPGEHPGRLLPSLLDLRTTEARLDLTHGRQKRDFTYVEDAVDAVVALSKHPGPIPSVVNVATGRLSTVRTFVETTLKVLGLPERRVSFGAIAVRAEEMAHDPVDVSRLNACLGSVDMASIEEGITRTVAHLGARPDPC